MGYNYPLYLTYDERRSGAEPIDPEDRWTSYTDEYIDFYPKELYNHRNVAGMFPHGLSEDEVHGEFKLGDPAFMLVVRYETGSTFGHSFGCWHIEGVYTSRDFAEAIARTIENDTYDIKYKPWVGYFERLERTEVYAMVVE